jgi:DNA primase
LAADDRALIEQIKEANDIVDVVGGYVALRPAGPTYKGLCPFHDDHRPSFDVDPRRQRYRCWSCGKYGDVFTFVQEQERVGFREALELLARRAGITLEKTADSPHQRSRALMLDVIKWAAEQYQHFLQEAPAGEPARRYLDERGLTEETIHRFGLGFAPLDGDWLLKQAGRSRIDLGTLEKVGLIAARDEGRGFYDRFRDRVMFPIRDPMGRTVAFGGRILPHSPYAARAPKYYNSADTPLFRKSEHLYGIDLAKQACAQAGCLAVVEGYTDVMMAHQMGVTNVVATMGTALNARHVHHLRRFVPRVVLVFDADQGGTTGVDRALEIFAGENVDLAIATLPEGLDPCDLLVQHGPEPFRQALEGAMDALEFKLNQVLAAEESRGVEGRRRAVDAVLGVIARAPKMPGQAGAVKQELMVTRIAHRMALQEPTVWARLKELRALHQERASRQTRAAEAETAKRQAPAAAEERQLLELLLAGPELVPAARADITPDEIAHPGLRILLRELYALLDLGKSPTLDALRERVEDPRLAAHILRMQDVGRMIKDRAAALRQITDVFRRRRSRPVTEELKNQLHATPDHEAALELLRQLQAKKEPGSGTQGSDKIP